MGVDIQTYRARIGTYSHSQGSDATLVQNFRDDFKTVGCVLFIGILLIIAGIEINPGPKEKETANVTTCAKSSRIKFSQLKENTNEGELKSFFEKQEEIGGGKVKHMYTDSDNNSAIIECEDNLVENRILDNNPLKIDGLENAVDIHVDEDNSSAQSALVRKSLEENIFDQQFASDIDRKNQLGAAERASKFGRKCVKRFRKGLEFFKPTAKLSQVGEASENDNDNLQIVHSGKSLGDETIDQQFGCDCDQTTKMTSNSGHKFRLRNLEGLRNNFESLKSAAKRGAGSFIAMLPGKDATHRDAKKLDSQLTDWDIAPTSNMHESSNYWIWFVVKYKQQLKEKYGYGIDNIPSSWNNVTISEALESLNKIFSA